MTQISVIIPVGNKDYPAETLMEMLLSHPSQYDVVLSVQSEADAGYLRERYGERTQVVVSSPGRGVQLNAGVKEARGDFLWFLHADSVVPKDYDLVLREATGSRAGLYYFQLRFDSQSSLLMLINQIGAYLRSRLLSLPFGDQGFFIRRESFLQLGGFSEDLNRGEDHEFVWKAKIAKVPIVSLSSYIITSSRRYRSEGWLSTTSRHLYLTVVQAWRYSIRARKWAATFHQDKL